LLCIAGHLWVKISVATHPIFRREGADIHVEVPISISLATLGGYVTVPTLTGEAQLKVDPGNYSLPLYRYTNCLTIC
jgi:molecular chaperone DnaJ